NSIDTNIAERKLAEQALMESEQKLKDIIYCIGDWVWETDENGIYTSIENNGINKYGYLNEEIIGKTPFDFMMPEEADKIGVLFLEIAASKQNIKDLENWNIQKDGQSICLLTNGIPILDEDGNLKGYRGVDKDITERKKLEESLKVLSVAIENTKASVVITDINGTIEYANPFFSQLTGYSQSEYIGNNPRILKSDLHPEEFYTNLWNTILSGRTWEGELYNIKKNGEGYWEKAIISPIRNLKNDITHFVAIKTDISETKILHEELIRSKEKAEESDLLKSAFLSNMSHEIRTPMNGILGFAELLKEPNLTSDQQQDYIRIINKSGLRMLNIINDIIDISKIESGQMKLDISKSNINEQIEYIYSFFKTEVERKGMQLSYRISLPAKDAAIYTDREKLYAIFTNLVKNAIKYTDQGSIEFGYVSTGSTTGSVSAVGELVEPVEPVEPELEFYVKDTGIGIHSDRHKAVFERFIQADISDSRAFQGAGLGLSIAKAYVEMLGGKIRVESESGIGSTFYFTLPYRVKSTEKNLLANEGPAETEKKLIRKLKVLVAEDDEASQELLSISLQTITDELQIVSTGVDAVEACRNHPDIDLVLMDIEMPLMDGYFATRQIRQFNTDIIIIAQTAFGLQGDQKMALDAGCNDYISKPINSSQLHSLIQKHFQE
ncbi:MAG: PAS domain S-box protein, partial [Bacteroidia bacterium]